MMLWSWILAAIGVTGLYLTTRKLAVGFAVGVAVQVIWIAYAFATEQWGFIASALAYGAVNALGLYRWTREKAPHTHGGQLPPPNLDLIETRVPGGREVKRRMEKAIALDEARLARNAARAERLPARPNASWRAPREGGYQGSGGVQPSAPPSGTSATSRGHTPPPPRGGSGQATAR